MAYFSLAQFQNLQKKKVEQTQRKALLQELEEKQSKRKVQPKSVGPRGSIASYGTSDDDVFLEPVSHTKPFLFEIIIMDFSLFRLNALLHNDTRQHLLSVVH